VIDWQALRTRAVATALMSVMLAAFSAPALAQRTKLGPRAGVNFDNDNLLLGFQFITPLAGRVDFYPSIDVYFPDRGSLIGINLDIRVLFPSPPPIFYLGGGLNVLRFRRDEDDDADSDAGINLMFGVEFPSGSVHPFFEGRVLLHDESSFQIVGGLNFVIGR
jgi:hypothetical protein